MRYLYRYQWDTDIDTNEIPIPIPMRYRYRYPWDADTDTHEIPIPIPMRYRYRYPWDTNTDTIARSAKRKFFRLPPRASRPSQLFLYYLREPPGQTPQYYLYWGNTKHIEEKFLYYLREPPGDTPNTTFNGAIHILTRSLQKHCKNHKHSKTIQRPFSSSGGNFRAMPARDRL